MKIEQAAAGDAVEILALQKLAYRSEAQICGDFRIQPLIRHLEEYHSRAVRFELFTSDRSLRNLYLYAKLGYREFMRERVNDNLELVYLKKPGGERSLSCCKCNLLTNRIQRQYQ